MPAVSRTDSTAASNHTVDQDDPSRNILWIDGEVTRSTHREYAVDLGPAVALASNASSARLTTLAIVQRIRTADPAERGPLLREAVRGLAARTTALRARERVAIQAYGAGDQSPRAFLLELARIDIAARELEHRRTRLRALAAETAGVSLDQRRLATLARRIDSLRGPVRARAATVIQGGAPASRFSVLTGNESVVLSTLVDGTYVREAYRGDRYRPGGRAVDPEVALEIAERSYPVIWATRRNNTEVTGSGGNYLVRIPHERGLLLAYVDAGTGAVYKEVQYRPLATISGTESVSTTKDGLRLTVNRTYAGGALRIGLVDAETGFPVDANVTIGQGSRESELVGRTGADGQLWTLSPHGRFTVTVIRGNAAVVLTVRPSAPPALTDESTGQDDGATGGPGSGAESNTTATA